MRLRKECEHGRWEEHSTYRRHSEGDGWTWTEKTFTCPGGEFLPEGALVIEKVDGEWPAAVVFALEGVGPFEVRKVLDALAEGTT